MAPQLRSLSLDYTAYEILFSSDDSGAEAIEDENRPMTLLEFPSLRCYGTYWDAAYHTLVGLPLALPALGLPRTRRRQGYEPTTGPPYIHTALYPAQLESLAATLESVFTNPELGAANAWAGVEQWRVEGTLADLDLVDHNHEDEEEEDEDDLDVQEGDESDNEGDAAGGLGTRHGGRRTGSSASPPPPPLSRHRESRITSLVRLARSHANLDLKVEPSGSGDPVEAAGYRAAGGRSAHQPQLLQRATFERGFGTSWWRFVDEVERELL